MMSSHEEYLVKLDIETSDNVFKIMRLNINCSDSSSMKLSTTVEGDRTLQIFKNREIVTRKNLILIFSKSTALCTLNSLDKKDILQKKKPAKMPVMC